jgi:HEAT repeat protein
MAHWPGILFVLLAVAGCAQPKGRGLVDDDASFKIPAIKAAVERNDADAIPDLVAALNDDDAAVRFYAIQGLRRLTGQTFDYRFYDDEPQRQQAVQRWKQWLEQRGDQ